MGGSPGVCTRTDGELLAGHSGGAPRAPGGREGVGPHVVRSRQPGSRPEDAGRMSHRRACLGWRCPSRAGWMDTMAPVITDYAGWILFAWILANQGGVPVPVVPVLLGAGALAGSGRLSIAVILAVAVGATLCADLGWYSLGRWRGARALDVLRRVSPRAGKCVRHAEHAFVGHARTFQL